MWTLLRQGGRGMTLSIRRMSRAPHVSPLVDADVAVKLKHNTPELKFMDASWFLGEPGKGQQGFIKERIAGAAFFDIDAVADKESSLPHMLPSTKDFADHMTTMRISPASTVVVYNQPNCFSAARCWWTLKSFGHPSPVYVLNGGLNAWKEAGGEIDVGPPESDIPAENSPYPVPEISSKLVANKEDVLHAMKTGIRQICDARGSDRFWGRVAEPRPGLEAGHIPGSLNLPFMNLLIAGDPTRFKNFEELRAYFDDAGVVHGSEVIFTCGSGVTAAVLALARNHIGADSNLSAVYDGSWSEWGADSSTPKVREQ